MDVPHENESNSPRSHTRDREPEKVIPKSRLTYSRNTLIKVAHDTIAIAQRGDYVTRCGTTVTVKDAVAKSIKGTVHYHHSHDFTKRSPSAENIASSTITTTTTTAAATQPTFSTKFHVVMSSPLEVAFEYRGSHVGVLNSASGKIPGGRFQKGLLSHEDVICRATLLYPCIAQFEMKPDHFYMINNALPKGTNTACAIFSPNVPVIRKDTPEGDLLEEFQECSFVTIPAPNGFILHDENDFLKDAMKDRIFRLLSIFSQHGCIDLVLCAFGCGVHGNDPHMVAAMFKEFLMTTFKGHFKNVVFSIQPNRYENFIAFNDVFKGEILR